jgi:HD-GYP domain-containing protein (c-di-GMP phosphodiesterase class II)
LAINDKTIAGYCALTKKLVNVPDVYNISPDAPYSFSTAYDMLSGYTTTSNLAIPLQTAGGKLLGVIQIINSQDENGNVVPFSEDDEYLITHFATNATMALQRAYLIRAMILRTIEITRLRDPKETGTHVNRVAGYAVEIYERWAFNNNIPEGERVQFKDALKIASMFHDVGKVAISDIILKKPGRFTPEEFVIMQQHTLEGKKLFENPQSPADVIASDVALSHHENWDGTGYPMNLKGEEIPLTARIVALADVYDALCSRRVYKEPWTEDDVLKEMKKLSGTKFDPELLDIFFEVLPNLKQINSLYPELNTD